MTGNEDWHILPLTMELNMPTRNVVLTQRQSDLIDHLVEEGVYQNASEVLREGLRLVEEHRDTHAAKLAALRAAIQVGIDDYEAGRFIAFDDDEALEAHLKMLTDQALSSARKTAVR
ncbi:MAG TPA: type II toxin-antitoxin system ParD family antitoxin [Caulobacteraceae bacterium]